VPDLFGLALEFGAFGMRGLGLLGSGLNGFGLGGLNLLGSGLGGFGVGGQNLLGSDQGSYSLGAGLESRQWGPGPILYPASSCALPR
jgi:hypothetical protein